MDIGKVSSDSGIFWSTGELREFTGRVNGPSWALVEIEGGKEVWGAPTGGFLLLVGVGFPLS